VLVIDAHQDSLEMYATCFEWAGIIVTAAPSAAVALKSLGQGRPDVIVADVHLTDLSGLDLAHRIKSDPATAALPVILLTTDLLGDVEARAQAEGCAAVCVKPYDPQALLHLITAVARGLQPSA
jgi:CheY-like chemotaxis protein